MQKLNFHSYLLRAQGGGGGSKRLFKINQFGQR